MAAPSLCPLTGYAPAVVALPKLSPEGTFSVIDTHPSSNPPCHHSSLEEGTKVLLGSGRARRPTPSRASLSAAWPYSRHPLRRVPSDSSLALPEACAQLAYPHLERPTGVTLAGRGIHGCAIDSGCKRASAAVRRTGPANQSSTRTSFCRPGQDAARFAAIFDSRSVSQPDASRCPAGTPSGKGVDEGRGSLAPLDSS